MSAPFKQKEWPGWMKKINKYMKSKNLFNPDKPNPHPPGTVRHFQYKEAVKKAKNRKSNN